MVEVGGVQAWVLLVFLPLLIRFHDKASGAEARSPRSRIIFQLHSVETCKKVNQYVDIKNFSLSRNRAGDSFINGVFHNSKEAKSFSRAEIILTACNDAVSFNTCEYVSTWNFVIGVCGLVTADSAPWSNFLKAVQPPLRCPVQKGEFILTNGTINMEGLEKWAGTLLGGSLNKVWLPEARVYNEKNELHACFTTKVSFMRVRA